jgi:hypothetical protein
MMPSPHQHQDLMQDTQPVVMDKDTRPVHKMLNSMATIMLNTQPITMRTLVNINSLVGIQMIATDYCVNYGMQIYTTENDLFFRLR